MEPPYRNSCWITVYIHTVIDSTCPFLYDRKYSCLLVYSLATGNRFILARTINAIDCCNRYIKRFASCDKKHRIFIYSDSDTDIVGEAQKNFPVHRIRGNNDHVFFPGITVFIF